MLKGSTITAVADHMYYGSLRVFVNGHEYRMSHKELLPVLQALEFRVVQKRNFKHLVLKEKTDAGE